MVYNNKTNNIKTIVLIFNMNLKNMRSINLEIIGKNFENIDIQSPKINIK